MGTRSTPAESLTTFWSGDLNVSISGHIISDVEPGQSEGVVFELATASDAVQIVSLFISIPFEKGEKVERDRIGSTRIQFVIPLELTSLPTFDVC